MTSPSPAQNSPAPPNGFTIIELLTVIAVIVILAALIFPIIGKAREKADVAKTNSNLRSINQSIMLYAADNGNALPKAKFFTGSWPSCDWQWAVGKYGQEITEPYLDSWAGGIHRCPLKKDWSIAPGTNDGIRISYSMNSFTTNSGMEPITKMVVDIEDPVNTWLVGTSGAGHVAVYNTTFLKRKNAVPRYRGGWFVSFCDGHSQWVADKDLSFDLKYVPTSTN